MAEKRDIVVAGGGLAGLAAGTLLPDAVVLEKEAIPGGLLASPSHDGFTIDLVPHVFFTRDQTAIRFFEESVGAGRFLLTDSDVRVWSHGVLTRFPFQSNLKGLPAEAVVDCLHGFAAARGRPPAKVENFQDFALASFGDGVVRRFLDPYNRKLWGVDALSDLTCDWVSGKVGTLSPREVVEGAFLDRRFTRLPNAEFRYPIDGGIQSFATGAARRVPGLRLGAEIARIDLEARRVATVAGEEYEYRKLIYTLSLTALPRLVSDLPAEVAAAVGRLRYRDVIGVHFGVGREDVASWHWMYLPEPEFPFYRVSFPSRMSSANAPRGCSCLIAEVAVDPGEPVDFHALMARCRAGLVRCGVLRESDPVLLAKCYRLSPAYVVYDHARAPALGVIEQYLESHDVLTAGRFGKWRFFNMDHTLLSGMEAAARATAEAAQG